MMTEHTQAIVPNDLSAPLTPSPILSAVASRALDADPRELLSRWFGGLGESARRKYSLALRSFVSWASQHDNPAPEDALRILVGAGRVGARNLVLGWRDEMLATGKATGTVAGLVSALSSLVAAARMAGLCDWGLEKVSPRVEPRHDRSGPPRHEVERLLEFLDTRASAGEARAARDAAIVRLLHNAAFRRSEVVGLRFPCDLLLDHPEGPAVHALRKGYRERQQMLIGRLAAASVRLWIESRGDWSGPLFHRLHAAGDQEDLGHLSGEAVRLMLRQRAKQAGCGAACRPHGLRHTAASHAARQGSLASLKALGGWKTLSAPAHYLDLCNRDREQAIGIVEA